MTMHSVFVVLTTVMSMMATTTTAQFTPPLTIVSPAAACSKYPLYVANSTSGLRLPLTNLMAWQSVLLIIGIGLFGVVLSYIYRLIRKRLYNDDTAIFAASDSFFNAGGNVHFALVASSVIARWLWVSSFSWSTLEVYKFGLVGHFWYSAATSVPILLFAIAAFQLRVNAPGAKTYLQVIKRRFGSLPHVVTIAIALIVNVLVGGMILMEAIRVITSVTQDVSQLAIGVLISVTTGLFSSRGGVGGGLYFNYFAIVAVVSIALAYFIDTFYNPLQRAGSPLVAPIVSTVYNATSCVALPPYTTNTAGSALTFSSVGALVDAITILLSGIGGVFVDQSFWQAATMATPSDAVGGFISGGLTFFVIPFVFSFVFGISFWTISVQQGGFGVDPATANSGLLPAIVSQLLLNSAGDFLIVTLTLVVTISALSSQLLSIVTIMTYDIYLTYVEKTIPAPSTSTVLNSDPSNHSCHIPKTAQVVTTESKDYVRFKRTQAFLKFVFIAFTSLILFTSANIMLRLNVSLEFVFKLVGIISGSAVVPVVLSVAWHRTTTAGVLSGIFVGFAAGFTGWLAYAGAQSGPLYVNVGLPLPFLVGLALSLGLGGLVCLVVSLLFGGCEDSNSEESMWEKTARIDNPLSPWTATYADNIDVTHVNKQTGLPDYKKFRRSFRNVEALTYIGSALFSLILMVFWPALMLTAGIFTATTFTNWATLVLALGIIATAYIGIVPPILELIVQGRQFANNRNSEHTRLADDRSSTSDANGLRTLQTVNVPQLPEHHMRFANLQNQQQSAAFSSPGPAFTDAVTNPAAAVQGNQVWKTSVRSS